VHFYDIITAENVGAGIPLKIIFGVTSLVELLKNSKSQEYNFERSNSNNPLNIFFQINYDINAKSHMARYEIFDNNWVDMGPLPALGSYGFCAFQDGIVVVGGKKGKIRNKKIYVS
jgi:hypothetical protein